MSFTAWPSSPTPPPAAITASASPRRATRWVSPSSSSGPPPQNTPPRTGLPSTARAPTRATERPTSRVEGCGSGSRARTRNKEPSSSLSIFFLGNSASTRSECTLTAIMASSPCLPHSRSCRRHRSKRSTLIRRTRPLCRLCWVSQRPCSDSTRARSTRVSAPCRITTPRPPRGRSPTSSGRCSASSCRNAPSMSSQPHVC
mmetsp:Transcript_25508/g.60225  ORF Transcript_25508/g.60225 Transcript_25508/m.60225 type:complete len:201 (+) Transcript_25508:1867-2469(+)